MKFLSFTFIITILALKSFACIPPIAPIQGYGSTICMGSTVTLTDDTTGGVWTSFDTTIARINASTGVVTPVSVGIDTIYYTLTTSCGSNRVALAINVSALPIPVYFSTLSVGSYCVFTLPAGAAMSAVTGAATWTSGTDTLWGTTVGAATFTVTSSLGCVYHDTVRVDSFPVIASIIVDSSLHGCIGNSGTLTCTTAGGTWSSSNPTVATVAPTTGMLNETAAGIAYITYSVTSGAYTGWKSVKIMVDQVPAAIAGRHSVCVGDTIMLSTDHYWSVFSTTISGVNWSSSSTATATVSSATTPNVVVTGAAWGSIILTATSINTGCRVNTTITVDTLPVYTPITGTTTLCSSLSTTLHESVPGGAWSSSNTTIATVNSTGVVFGMFGGTATISYSGTNSCGTALITTPVTVNALPALALTTGPNIVAIGSTITLVNATTGGTWTSSAPAVASVSATGLVTGVSSGISTITYSVSNSAGCNNFTTATVAVVPTVGITDVNEKATVSMFPNPAHESFNVLFNNTVAATANLIIKDMVGKVVYSTTINNITANQQINTNITALNVGVYFVTVQLAGVTYTDKLVVQ